MLKRLLAILGACIVAGIVCVLLVYLLVISAAEPLAHRLAPPVYPGSQLIESWQSGGTQSRWDRRTYRTQDSLDRVLAFMEQHMPGFKMEMDPDRGMVYRNHAEDTSILAKGAAEFACSSRFCIEFSALVYPSASVTFYTDPTSSMGTIIQIWIDWPAP